MTSDPDFLDTLIRATLPYAWGPDKNFVALADSYEQPIILTTARLATREPTILYANLAFRKMCCYSLDQLVGQSASFFHGERTDEKIDAAFRAELGRSGKASMKLVNYRADGSEYGVHITAKFAPAVPPYADVFVITASEIPLSEALGLSVPENSLSPLH